LGQIKKVPGETASVSTCKKKTKKKKTKKPENHRAEMCFSANQTAYFENVHWLLFVHGYFAPSDSL